MQTRFQRLLLCIYCKVVFQEKKKRIIPPHCQGQCPELLLPILTTAVPSHLSEGACKPSSSGAWCRVHYVIDLVRRTPPAGCFTRDRIVCRSARVSSAARGRRGTSSSTGFPETRSGAALRVAVRCLLRCRGLPPSPNCQAGPLIIRPSARS